MKPDSPEPSGAQLHLLRQQLILTQARMLELEDARLALVTRVALLDRNLADLQCHADGKIAERDHLANHVAGLEEQISALRAQLHDATTRSNELESVAHRAAETAAAHQTRAKAFETELAAVHQSLTWRWTEPLRRLARFFRPSP